MTEGEVTATMWRRSPTKIRTRKFLGKRQVSGEDGVSFSDHYLHAHRKEKELQDSTKDLFKNALKGNRFCKGLSEAELESICSKAQYFEFDPGEDVMKQGDPGNHMFVAESGYFDVTVNDKVANQMSPWSVFGTIALLYHCPRTATVTVKNETAGIWGIEGAVFRNIVQEHTLSTQSENLQLLEQVSVLDGLSTSQKLHIAASALHIETFRGGDLLQAEGEMPTALYLIKSGTLKIVKGGTRSSSGTLDAGETVSIIKAGDCFGERELLKGTPLEASLIAESSGELVAVSRQKLIDILGEDVEAQLEKGFVSVSLRRVPLIYGMAPADQVRVVREASLHGCAPSQSLSEIIPSTPVLVLVVDGELRPTGSSSEIVLRRASWCQDSEFDDLDLCRDGSFDNCIDATPCKLRSLAAGSSGSRIAILTVESVAKGLCGLETAPGSSTADFIDYIRKVLCVKRVPLFRGLADHQTDSVIKALQLQSLDPEQVVFNIGDPADKFYIIASGEVKVEISGNTFRRLGRGSCFGERALLFDEPRSAKVTAIADKTTLWHAHRDIFDQCVAKNMQETLMERARLHEDRGLSLKALRHIRFIGKGAFGSVRLVVHARTGSRYALKRVKKSDADAELEVRKECEILGSIRNSFVVTLIQTFETESSIYILTELVTGGQLYVQMTERMGVLSRKQAQFYMGSIVIIMEALHLMNIVYRDLKPENVMLDTQGYVKLVDFGLAKRLDDGMKTFSVVGTTFYMAPEIVQGHGYLFEVDFWSVGVMLYELMCGRVPFGAEADDEQSIFASAMEDPLVFPERFNDSAGKKLIEGLLTKDPTKRLGVTGGWHEVKEHKFFKAIGNNDLFSKLISRELAPPFVPDQELFSKEDEIDVSGSDMEEFSGDSNDDLLEKAKVLQLFRMFDTTSRGKISREELARVMRTLNPEAFGNEANVDQLMMALDANADGWIDFKEFLDFVYESAQSNENNLFALLL